MLRKLLPCLALFLLHAVPALAQDTPHGEVILTVNGTLAKPNQADRMVFDQAMLEKLPQKKYTVQLPWLEGPQTFEGPLLADVLAQSGASGKTVTFRALNDYSASMDVEEAKKHGVILALRQNGKLLTVRTKGPLFVMFPFDRNEALRTPDNYRRCVWQLNQIDVR
ncbi:molybdopterin-dependent oxidoreductase [Chitinilyticum litopenaei]|uniref:molybdopterin-dependent oxidoreductase n=1 Tax=Chitinilyticum litopenaei TaxID=1121276 RepID=UPI0004187577|nr:molybdopterin-dependent oxidoreductase [Chitinilyticum litopenaei]